MFTGLVQAMGTVRERSQTPSGIRLEVEPTGPRGTWGYRPAPGESISVSGCCLTIAAPAGGRPGCSLWAFDIVPETLAKTTLGGLGQGSLVNLEHSVTPATLLGGHLVQGHVDGVGTVDRVDRGEQWRLRIRPPAGLMEFMVPKGSVALDGVSLTLAAVDPEDGWLEVALIPTTLEVTTLGALRAGDRCNIEADSMAKTVVHWLKHFGRGPGGR
jgi:riboflavin synthase